MGSGTWQRRRRLLGTLGLFALALAVVGGAIWWGRWHGNCDAVAALPDSVQVDMSAVVEGAVPGRTEHSDVADAHTFAGTLCVDDRCSYSTFNTRTDSPAYVLVQSRGEPDAHGLGPAGTLHTITASVRFADEQVPFFSATASAPAHEQSEGQGNCALKYFAVNLAASGTGASARLA